MKAVTGTRRIEKVVITRSMKGNAELASKLRKLGFEPVSIDGLEFLPPSDWSGIDSSLSRLDEFDWLLFTSATGAEFFARRMNLLGLPMAWRGKPAVAAVGEKTSAALEKLGIEVDFVPSVYLAKALAEELPRGRGKEVLILRAEGGDPDVVPTLVRGGFNVTDHALYRTSPLADQKNRPENAPTDADAIIFASPSAVEAFMKRFDSAEVASGLTKGLLALCIGPVTAAAAKERGFERVLTPKVHTLDGVLERLREAAEERS